MSIKQLWGNLLKTINGLSILLTFLLIPVSIGGIVYFSFICYDLSRAILNCIALWLMIDSNKKL